MIKREVLYLTHIVDAIDRIFEFTVDGKEHFFSDRKTQDAVIRNFEIVGEATRRLSQDFRNTYPDVPWRELGGFRDVLIHKYDRVDLVLVWKRIDLDLTSLQSQVAAVLAEIS